MSQSGNELQKEIKLEPGTFREQISTIPDKELQQIFAQANQWADYTKFTRLMTQIARDMKEIPELPSEKVNSKESSPLTKVEFPDEGGVLTWMENYDYPFKGYPFHEFVDKIDTLKKLMRSTLSGMYYQLKWRNKLWFLTLIPGLWISRELVRVGVYAMYRIVERFRLKTKRYCTFVRELHRAFSAASQEDFPRTKREREEHEVYDMLRDLVCMVLEFDNAYRFRAQDILAELDKEHLEKNTAGELERLIDIMMKRERHQEIRDTWRLAKYGLRYYLRYDKKLTRLFKRTLLELDLDMVRLSIEDKAFCVPRKDYTFGFMSNPDKDGMRLIQLAALRESWNTERERIRNENKKEYEALLQKHQVEKEGNGELKESMMSRHYLQLKEIEKKYDALLKNTEESYVLEKRKLSRDIHPSRRDIHPSRNGNL